MPLMGTALVLGVVIAQSCLNLCDPKDYSLPGSSVHGNSQARIVEWVAISFSRGSSQIRDGPMFPGMADRFFTTISHPTREASFGSSPCPNLPA